MASTAFNALLLLTPHAPVPVHRSRSTESPVSCTLPPDSIFEFSRVHDGWACLSPSEHPRSGHTASEGESPSESAWCVVDREDGFSLAPLLQHLLPLEDQAFASAVTAHRFLMSQVALTSLIRAKSSDIFPTLCCFFQSSSAAAQVYACCACRTSPCVAALASTVTVALDVLKSLRLLLPKISCRRAACSALWAVSCEALAAHANHEALSAAWRGWCDAVLLMADESELADALAGLCLSITSTSRQLLFVNLGVLPLLRQRL